MNIGELTRNALEECKKIDSEFCFFNVICEKEAIEQAGKAEGKLAGLMITVKDNICVKDVESTAGSKILKGHKPLFDATAVKRLRDAGAVILGKTSMDEFGFGSFNVNVGLGYKTPKNPIDKQRVTGGSSGGAAGITKKANFAHVAVAESTGGSIECPAAFCNVIGFCPTYGRISRYGLISYADSLDKMGLMSKKVRDIAPVLEVISGFDENDATSLKAPLILNKKKSLKVAVIRESMGEGVDEAVKKSVNETVRKLKKEGMNVNEVSLPVTFKYGIPVYYILAASEASTNLARFCGMRYGIEGMPKGKSFSDYFSEIRSSSFNEESKRRIMLGTFARMAGYRDAYYIKAARIRTMIINEYRELFGKYDVLISPTMPILPPKFDETMKMTPLQSYMMDILTVGPNLAGIPHASIPIGNMIGLMAMTDHLQEGILLQFLEIVEGLT